MTQTCLAKRTAGKPLRWLDPLDEQLPQPIFEQSCRVIVAIPARNEAASIGHCLRAIERAAAFGARHNVAILVLVNNTGDRTADIARSTRLRSVELIVEEVTLPHDSAHAGGARRAVMNAAALIGGPDAILMTTDADSRVTPGWIEANLAEIALGADAVAGVIAFDKRTRKQLDLVLRSRALEWLLAEKHAMLSVLIDPRPHNPWPTHIWAWGASLAITASAYRKVGGVPNVPLCEDRALAEAVEAHDLRLRHSHLPLVYTSARTIGRAPGGFADLLTDYARHPATVCDAALEPVLSLVRRLNMRAKVRDEGEGFGARWAERVARDPLLQRRRVMPDMLETEIARCDRLINALCRSE
jgi:cellulose synthase/poly-beta-1,6-N-acetylglucosamine synthase-like glycosyltransferase